VLLVFHTAKAAGAKSASPRTACTIVVIGAVVLEDLCDLSD